MIKNLKNKLIKKIYLELKLKIIKIKLAYKQVES